MDIHLDINCIFKESMFCLISVSGLPRINLTPSSNDMPLTGLLLILTKKQNLEAFFNDLEAFTQVYSQIKRLYVEDVDNKKLLSLVFAYKDATINEAPTPEDSPVKTIQVAIIKLNQIIYTSNLY
jgi:hypothetical protein